ncbi:phosphodiester glycosidase family protein [Nocardiopsis alborubida]|uniref:Phosphodiester glycosidase family protein n=1 Tax=Nocardiopsis alborubida TaxID=146802 RepID=A0A7X6MJI6_9ACTN|nr:phosphodiester glycosidase family protein [Nocardiopsis alborubida]NKZ02075.1 phosphodiester glycosidase family protein [Nocardiopsis alborubida]
MNLSRPRSSWPVRPAAVPVVAVLVAPMILAAPSSQVTADVTAPVGGIAGGVEERIATGVGLVSGPVPGSGGGGEQFASLLTVDLTEEIGIEYVDGGGLTSPATVADMAAAAEPPEGSTVVAAVNGGYFDIGATQAPLGAGMGDGRLLTSPDPGFTNAVVIDADGRGGVRRVAFDGTVSLPSGDLDLDALNTSTVPANGLGLYTSDWGGHPRAHVVYEPGTGAGTDPGDRAVAEAVISEGAVERVSDTPGSGPIEEDEQVLVARGSAAERIAELSEGDPVELEHALTAEGTEPRTVVGGRHVLVRDGEPVPVEDDSRAPRTAIGFSEDGETMHVVTADGRNRGHSGSTLAEVAALLAASGADQALELDGGGSSTLLVREPGGAGPVLRNRAGDQLREVPDGLVITAPEGSAEPSGLWLRPALEPRPGHGSPVPPQADPRRVFTGMHRTLAATGHDEAFGPSGPGAPHTPDDRTGELELSAPSGHGDGPRFVAGDPGPVTVTGRAGPLRGTVGLEVLPAPDTLLAAPQHLGMASSEDTASFVLTGVTGDGERAPVEPVDARIEAVPDLVEVVDRGDGGFEVRPRAGEGPEAGEGSGVLTVSAGGVSTRIPFSIGTRTTPLADFGDAREWTARSARGEAEVRPAAGRDGPGLALAYDFTRDIRTRTAAAHPPEPLTLDRQAFAFTVGVRGDGGGARLMVSLTDEHGVGHSLEGPAVDWEGWRDVRLEVPDDAGHPVTVSHVYLLEEDPSRAYAGEVVLDGLTAEAATGP